MNLETRITLKRITTLLCSIGTLVGYGYLIGGFGGYLFGRGRPMTAVVGFLAGSALAYAAISMWRSYLDDLSLLDERGGENSSGD
ncbi:MAG: hypothetical protein LBO21_03710 [Synergistaceae bacterium]|jgi:hypothetical protein|nr:hypothetical protein [Synergistaceae bacterium]